MTEKQKLNRDKQADVLRRTQAQRKEQKKEQVLKAIQEILTQKQPLTFANIAKVAGCSIAYLYKWPEITTYIHDLQQKNETQLHPLEEEGESKPNSLKTLHEVARQRISKLEAEIKELKVQNEKLRGHVTEIYELRDEGDRLRTQYRELTNPVPSDKVVPIRPLSQKPTEHPSIPILNSDSPSESEIFESIESIGIKLNSKLKQEIIHHDLNTVKLSIEAFQQYRSKTAVANPEGCLLTMIRDEAEPNGQHTSESIDSISSINSDSTIRIQREPKELLSLDKLQELSNIFTKKHE
jgi:Family of unknown function (DUF6262)